MDQKKVVALKYDKHNPAPRVIALGKGEIAEKILSLAIEKGVPIVSKPEVVDQLIKLELGQEIPIELYEVIAEILAFIYRLEEKTK